MLVHPRVVYKYKNISKKVDFDRTIDTVKKQSYFSSDTSYAKRSDGSKCS